MYVCYHNFRNCQLLYAMFICCMNQWWTDDHVTPFKESRSGTHHNVFLKPLSDRNSVRFYRIFIEQFSMVVARVFPVPLLVMTPRSNAPRESNAVVRWFHANHASNWSVSRESNALRRVGLTPFTLQIEALRFILPQRRAKQRALNFPLRSPIRQFANSSCRWQSMHARAHERQPGFTHYYFRKLQHVVVKSFTSDHQNFSCRQKRWAVGAMHCQNPLFIA